jgi:hypothetical protein
MKIERLVRNSDGTYNGSIGAGHQLTAQESRKVREALSKGPLHIGEIAKQCDIPVTHPARFNELCRYIETHLQVHTRESEMVFARDDKGRNRFQGWRLSEHGKKLLEVS